MDVKQAIMSRRSIREFKDEPISNTIIDELIRAAQAAPSADNLQKHVFGVIRDKKIKCQLAESAGEQMWISSAPVIIACCVKMDKNFNDLSAYDIGLEVNRLRFGSKLMRYCMDYPVWDDMALLFADSVPLVAAENISLTAISHGLSSCIVGWMDIHRASSILNLPPDIKCMYLMPIGYAKEDPPKKALKGIEKMIFYDTYKH